MYRLVSCFVIFLGLSCWASAQVTDTEPHHPDTIMGTKMAGLWRSDAKSDTTLQLMADSTMNDSLHGVWEEPTIIYKYNYLIGNMCLYFPCGVEAWPDSFVARDSSVLFFEEILAGRHVTEDSYFLSDSWGNDIDLELGEQVADYFSFDGFVVYKQDTIDGVLTVLDKELVLEQPIDSNRFYGYRYALKDTALKTIVLCKGIKEMCLVRQAVDNKRLWRLLHYGKLSVFDNGFDFVASNNLRKRRMWVSVNGGAAKPLKSFLKAGTKDVLVQYINQVYGLSLDPNHYSWTSLLYKLSTLD